ncbi:MAG TPA: alpha-glucosidase [Devosiaceae bacterium]|jgi:oligo-1,6-glucosidase|nr:alpha-glucosidase [Devosiaceae bacterium]
MPTSGADKLWWHDATVYQVYPRSFSDSNGDGIGDIPGITSRLDYLQSLGVELLWLSPIFKSPMDDNGYDISGYQEIAEEYGTLADFDRLLAAARDREIGIILDLVVNHTSDEHPWFLEARQSRDSRYRDFYIWRDAAPNGGVPNDIPSVFGGPAWSLDAETGQYYFHQFSRRQPDLNWENEAVRIAIYEMMNWWLDRGIAGFRMDVIDLIGKQVDEGITAEGPRLHEYLQEMHRETFGHRDVLTVGEAWSATPASALLYSGRDRNELSMVFQFEHVTQQWDREHGKWQPRPFDLVELKAVLNKWQLALADDGWNALFWGNHDLPRAVSKYGDDAGFHSESAKMLATVLHLMKGTPFIYQGEEIGMTNVPFTSIDQYRDIETLNMHRLHVEAGLSTEDFIEGANANARDNARTPMQWTAEPHGGFTTGVPWIEVNENFTHINAAQAVGDDRSIWNHYRRLISLRKAHPVIVYGRYQPYLEQDPHIFAYTRCLGGQTLLVLGNFSAEPRSVTLPAELRLRGRSLITNYEDRTVTGEVLEMAPYEAFALLSDEVTAR